MNEILASCRSRRNRPLSTKIPTECGRMGGVGMPGRGLCEEWKLRGLKVEAEFQNHVPEFKEGLEVDEDFASREFSIRC